MLSAAMILSLIPATVVKADPEKEMYTRNIEVTVLAYSTEEKMDFPVEGAVVTLENGKTVLAEAVSDAEGIAVIPLEGIAAEDLPDADVHA